ncbi:MAG: glycoside hydrolase family 97 protein [Bacteroidales bacterium]|nr:glycoside hydrolase family 97 protein [Candidatus Hennigimonas equi]
MRRAVLFCILSLLASSLISCTDKAVSTDVTALSSPGNVLQMTFALDGEGHPYYSLDRGDTKVLLPSGLGFELRGVIKAQGLEYDGDKILKPDELPPYMFNEGFSVVDVSTSSLDETWSPVWGEESSIRNNYNELLVCLKHVGDDKLMNIRFRLYDDGLGFRYEFPGNQPLGHFVVKEELSEFNCAQDNTAWWIPGDYDSQEYEYATSKLTDISKVFKDYTNQYNSSTTLYSTSGIQTSVQMKTPEGLYVNIHEAALVDYPCMHLICDGTKIRSWLTPDAQGWKGRLGTPCVTPWRTVQVAASAEEQLASRLILNLNEPCAYDDVSWIHPVKYMGVWWEMIAGAGRWDYTDASSVKLDSFDYASAVPHGHHSANNANVRKYIDFASANGFDGLLVEGWNIGWEEWANCNKDYVFDFVTPYPDFDIAALNEYAHSKGIRLIMHHETSSSVRNYERHMEAAYSLMNKYGYDAVKSGYVGDILPLGEYHYSQWMVNHYLYVVTQAAKHHIMVNAHEAVRPTGLCRTYPNLIGNESARGTEYQAFGGTAPEHVTILPFTRLNGGPMDFTPGIFEQNLKEWCGNDSHVNATIANQLALYVTMYSPLQMAADTPEHYAPFMDAFQFIKDVAVDWNQTRYIAAEPGDYLIIARQPRQETLSGSAREFSHGKDTWFLGGVTDENAREFDVALDFLGEGKYEAVIYADAPDAHYATNPQAYIITNKTVSADDTIHVAMVPGGGVAISFKKI